MDASKRTANRLALAYNDMRDANRYLVALQELSRLQVDRCTSEFFDHCEAITVAAIVAYCRSFKRSKTAGNADALLDPDVLAFFAERPDLKILHEHLIERRDKAVAHSDWEYHKTELISGNYKGGVLRRSSPPNITGSIQLTEFVELVEHVSKKCLYHGFDLDRTTL